MATASRKGSGETDRFLASIRRSASTFRDTYTGALTAAATECLEYFGRMERWTYAGTNRDVHYVTTRAGGMVRPPALAADMPEALGFSSQADGDDTIEQADGLIETELARAAAILREAEDLAPKTRKNLRTSLDSIEERRRDQRLFLGIVGEFSSGKSTLINALSRNPLLATSVLPATTQAPTVLARGERDDAEVFMADGGYMTYLHDGVGAEALMLRWADGDDCMTSDHASLREFVMKHSADESMDGRVQQLNVLCRDPSFHRGLAIVDTPGINAEGKAAHLEATRDALRNLCDAVIVLTPANAPLSQTLLTFLRQELHVVTHRLVFVLTKVDLLRPAERKAVLRHTEAVLRRELAIGNPVVFPLSALTFVDSLTGESGGEADKLTQEFLEAENAIHSFLRSNRSLIVLERLLSLTSHFHEDLRAGLRRMLAKYRRQHKQLVDAQIPDLEVTAVQWRNEAVANVRRAATPLRKSFLSRVAECRKAPMLEVQSAAASAQTKQRLQAVFESDVLESLSKAATALDKASREHAEALAKACRKTHEQFFSEFSSVYERLAPCAQDSVRPLTMGSSMEERLDGMRAEVRAPVLRDLDSAIKKDGYFQTGGAIAGAAIGATVAGPVGFFVGGFLGSKVRNFFGPAVDDLRREGLRQIGPMVESQMNDMEEEAERFSAQICSEAEKAVEEMIAGYVVEYERLANRLIEEDEQMKAEMVLKQEDTKKLLSLLLVSKRKLEDAGLSLRGARGMAAS